MVTAGNLVHFCSSSWVFNMTRESEHDGRRFHPIDFILLMQSNLISGNQVKSDGIQSNPIQVNQIESNRVKGKLIPFNFIDSTSQKPSKVIIMFVNEQSNSNWDKYCWVYMDCPRAIAPGNFVKSIRSDTESTFECIVKALNGLEISVSPVCGTRMIIFSFKGPQKITKRFMKDGRILSCFRPEEGVPS